MADLTDAIQELHHELSAGEDPKIVIPEIARLYNLQEPLLRRKFAESYGEPEKTRGAAERALAAQELEAQRERAKYQTSQKELAENRRWSW